MEVDVKYIFPRPYYVLQVDNLTFLPLLKHIDEFEYELVPHLWIAPNGKHMSTEAVFEFAQRNNVGFKRAEYYPNVTK
jgi:hypothetical protein